MKNKNAVVLIHGIGQQKPMDSLRSFVKAIHNHLITSDISEKNSIIRSKPDKISKDFETRILSLSSTRKRPITDFYEFYWAHNMEDNKLNHFSSWILKLLFISPNKVPKRIIQIWKIIWSILFLVTIGIISSIFIFGIENIKLLFSSITILLSISAFILQILKRKFLDVVGDAGRYLSPLPNNINARNKIRRNGIELLKTLHDKSQKYDRIIIIGHSLGSVIGYDLLRYLWGEYHDQHEFKEIVNQKYLEEINQLVFKKEFKNSVSSYQELQYKCFKESKANGFKWKISDFITIGSPLYSLDYLSNYNMKIKEKIEEKELVTNPPVIESAENKFYFHRKYNIKNGFRSIKIPNYSALFAFTRWSNIFYQYDYIGGEMKRLFGDGIKDVEIKRKRSFIIPSGHTNYWDMDESSVKEICNAMRL